MVRNGRRPMFVEIRNPSGIELCNYRLADCQQSPEKTILRFSMDRKEGGPMEWMVHEVRPRYNISDWSQGPQTADDTFLELELKPIRRTVGSQELHGFSYQYRYQSRSIPIYKILDRATWEIGGNVVGNQVWMRNCFVASIVQMESPGQFFSTEWYLPDCANPSPLQFAPLQTELQGFTFAASPAGVLVTWATEVAHIRSLFEKPRNETVMVHLHEHCADLGLTFASAPVEVLWSPGERDAVGLANDHESFRELVHETLHRQIGMRRERVTTYGQIEEWDMPDIDRYRRLGLPRLLAAGVKTVYLANHFQNNMNTWGVSNFCVTVDYKIAETVGKEALHAFCNEAREAGATVQMWGNTAISTLNVIFATRHGKTDRVKFLPREGSIMDVLDLNTCFVRNASNAIEADHYTPSFAVLNLRDSAVREYWLQCWQAAHDEVGLGAIFLDSSFNLSSDKFHYIQNTQSHLAGATADQTDLLGNFRPAQEPPSAILSQYHAHLHLMVEMQRIGYVYGNEDLGVFGIHRHGPGLAKRLDSLFLWSDCIAEFDAEAVREAGGNPDDIFFRGLAYRMMWAIYWDIKKDQISFRYQGARGASDLPGEWHLKLFEVYNKAESLMRDRFILPGEKGVLYRSNAGTVLWAFDDLSLALEPGAQVRDLLNDEIVVIGDALQAKSRRIYFISNGSSEAND